MQRLLEQCAFRRVHKMPWRFIVVVVVVAGISTIVAAAVQPQRAGDTAIIARVAADETQTGKKDACVQARWHLIHGFNVNWK